VESFNSVGLRAVFARVIHNEVKELYNSLKLLSRSIFLLCFT